MVRSRVTTKMVRVGRIDAAQDAPVARPPAATTGSILPVDRTPIAAVATLGTSPEIAIITA